MTIGIINDPSRVVNYTPRVAEHFAVSLTNIIYNCMVINYNRNIFTVQAIGAIIHNS